MSAIRRIHVLIRPSDASVIASTAGNGVDAVTHIKSLLSPGPSSDRAVGVVQRICENPTRRVSDLQNMVVRIRDGGTLCLLLVEYVGDEYVSVRLEEVLSDAFEEKVWRTRVDELSYLAASRVAGVDELSGDTSEASEETRAWWRAVLDAVCLVGRARHGYFSPVAYDAQTGEPTKHVVLAFSTNVVQDADEAFAKKYPMHDAALQGYAFPIGGVALYNTCVSTGRPYVAHDVATDPNSCRRPCPFEPNGHQLTDFVALPIFRNGRHAATIGLANFEAPGPTPERVARAEALLRIAMALDGAAVARCSERIAIKTAFDMSSVQIRAADEFFATVSHELRTPMNGVVGLLDVLARSEAGLSREHRNIVGLCQRAGAALTTVIDDVLVMAKLRSGTIQTREGEFSPLALAEDVVHLVWPTIASRNNGEAPDQDSIQMMVDVDLGVDATLLGDAGRLRQVVMNLVGNAVKFTHRGHVLVEMSIIERRGVINVPGTEWLRINVADTGIGIDEEAVPKLFAPFAQVDSGTGRTYDGTGLGLAISKGLVEVMGGSIRLESRVGVGSTFTVEIPLKVSLTAGQRRLSIADVVCASDAGKALSGKRVLLVDALGVRLGVVRKLLRVCGATVIHCTSLTVAKRHVSHARLQEQYFDLVFVAETSRSDEFVRFANLATAGAHTTAVLARASDKPTSNGAVVVIPLPSDQDTLLQGMRRALLLGDQKPLEDETSSNSEEASPMPAGRRPSNNDGPEDRRGSRGSIRDYNQVSHQVDESDEGSHSSDNPDVRSLRVLVVDDSEVNRIVTCALLKSLHVGHVRTACNGIEAIDMIKDLGHREGVPFDLVLMDVHMPQMSGIEATKILLRREFFPSLRVVGLTADVGGTTRRGCIEAGMIRVLTKPVSSDTMQGVIFAAVKWHVSQSRTASADTGHSDNPPSDSTPSDGGRSDSTRSSHKSDSSASREKKGTPIILVIDDDPVNCLIVTKLIERVHQDVVVSTFQDPRAALEQLADPALATRVVGLLVDVHMPFLTGQELIDKLSKLSSMAKRLAVIPVVLMTASVDSKEITPSVFVNQVVDKPLRESVVNSLFS